MSGKYPHYRCGISCLLLLFAALLLPGGNLQANTVIIGGDAVVTPPGPDPSFDVNGGSTVEVQEGAFVEAVGDDNGIQTGAGYTVTNSGSISGDNNNGGAVIDTGNGLFIDGNGTVTNNLNGIITGTTVSGPSSAGNGLRLVGIGIINNSGQITGACDFGINTHNGNGIYVTNGLTLTNQSNSIISGDTGLALAGGTASANGIYISNASMNSTITNYGSITGRVADSAASLQGNGMVLLSGAFVDGTILNYGIIEGSRTGGDATNGNGVYFSVASGTLQVTNYGRISSSNLGYGIYNTQSLNLNNGADGVIAGVIGIYCGGGNADFIANSGTITGTGGTAIILGLNNDSLTLQSGSAITGEVDGGAGSDTLTFAGQGTANFNILNFEKLFKTGSGSWRINTDLAIANTVQANCAVSGGTLLLNNTLTTTNGLLISAGGSLGGSCNITGSVTNNGTIKPGNSIGTTSITGTYTQGASGVYEVELQGNGSNGPGVDNDLIEVTGNAVLAGTVKPTNTSLVRGRGDFTILRTTGGLGGTTFDLLDFSSPTLTLELDYSNLNEVHLLSTRFLYSDFPGLTINQKKIAKVLDQAILAPTPDMEEVLLEIDDTTISLAEYQNALDAISPEPLATLPQFTFATANTFTNLISKRLEQFAQHRLSQRDEIIGLSRRQPLGPAGLDVKSAEAGKTSSGAWFEPFGYWADQDKYRERFGYDSHSAGFVTGCDRTWERVLLGAGLGYANTDIDWREVTAEGEIESLSLSLYNRMSGKRFFLDTAAIYSHHWYDTEREIRFGSLDRQATGGFDGDSLTLLLGYGSTIKAGFWKITPQASLHYTYQKTDEYCESGAGALNLEIDEEDFDSLESSLGISASYLFTTRRGICFRPELRASWIHEYLEKDEPVIARFNGGGNAFAISGVSPDNDRAVIGAGLEMQLSDRLSTSVDFDACFSRHYNAQALTAGLTLSF